MSKYDLRIITESKKLFSYIVTITIKSPVKYRYTFVSKMHNLCMEIVENLYYANEIALGDGRRKEYQRTALIKLRLLDYVCEAAKEALCITSKQYEFIVRCILSCINLLNGWILSDDQRCDNL